jgi:hypothetical protein
MKCRFAWIKFDATEAGLLRVLKGGNQQKLNSNIKYNICCAAFVLYVELRSKIKC